MTSTLHQFTMTLTLLYVIKTQDNNQISYFIVVNASYETMICNEWQSKLNNKCNSIDFNIPQDTSWDCTIRILQNIFLAIWNEISHYYRQVSNIRRTLLGNKFVDHSDVVGASPVGAAPTTSSFSTYRLASLDWTKTTSRRGEEHLNLVIWYVWY